MRKCPGASAAGRKEGGVNRTKKRVGLSVESDAGAGEAQNAESNNE